jgi:tripeptide aminopeptidase
MIDSKYRQRISGSFFNGEKSMINRERLAETFKMLAERESVSREEANLSGTVQDIFKSLGGKIVIDSAGEKTGADTGNLIVKFSGNSHAEPMMLNAHMDTVEPGRGIRAVFENGIFTSTGDTILGADDKSAIAILIEAMRVIVENDLECGPIEIVLTICEEIGLEGAKHLDYDLITAKFGYALDSTDIEGIVTKAPAANRLTFTIHGKDAHAGAAPEKGINAILLASKAMAGLEIGRIDAETTCNIGVIEGGRATNIVPDHVVVKGEVRSHDKNKLDKVTETIVSSFKAAINDYREKHEGNDLPRLDVYIEKEFVNTHIPQDHPVVRLAQNASKRLGRSMRTKTTGGGSDANIFFEKGIIVGVLGTGMRDMHTVRESVALDDMVKATELLVEIVKINAEELKNKD